MNIPDLHRRAVDSFNQRVGAVGERQWDAPTPCDGWSVRAVVRHVTHDNGRVAPVLAGESLDDPGDGAAGDPLGNDPARAAIVAGRQATDAIAAKGALDGIKQPPHGDFPGEVYALQRFTENLIHGWDVAHATGGDERLDPELVAACTAFFDEAEDLYRAAGFVGPRASVPEGADPQTVLLARFGRTAT